MIFSYRTRQLLSRIFTTTVLALLVVAVGMAALTLWLQRFLVYEEDGVRLDFQNRPDLSQSRLPQPDIPSGSVEIIYDDSPYDPGMGQLVGYYIDPLHLQEDPGAVQASLAQLEPGTAVLLDVKGYRGYFYYPTTIANTTTSKSYDMDAMQQLLSWLSQSELYVIARLSAFRDFDYAGKNNACGLPMASGALYSDSDAYGLGYWLDPANNQVQTYLIDILNELQKLGVDEVVLENFCFPDTNKIVYEQDKTQALTVAAANLVTACANKNFVISFAGKLDFALPGTNCRLYLQDVAPSELQSTWDNAPVSDQRTQLVLLIPFEDERYQLGNGLLTQLLVPGL